MSFLINKWKNQNDNVVKAAARDTKNFAKSKLSTSLVHKKKF